MEDLYRDMIAMEDDKQSYKTIPIFPKKMPSDPSFWVTVDLEDYARLCHYRWVHDKEQTRIFRLIGDNGPKKYLENDIIDKRIRKDCTIVQGDGEVTDFRKENLKIVKKEE